jgi:tol-pal system protein YbgF
MKQTISALVLSLALAAAWAAPISAADKETRQMMADIRILQEQLQQLQNQVQTTVTALTEATKALDARVTARLDQQTDVTQKALADQKTVITSISSDLRNVREKLDDNTTRLGSLTLEVQALRQLFTASRTSFAAPDATPSGASASNGGAPPAGLSPSAAGASPQAMYDGAYGDYTAGQWDLAIDGFQDVIKSFPSSSLAADAQVMICNAYATSGNYDKAVEACDTAIRNYPNGAKTSTAYYRKGLAYQALKQPDRAREAFEFITKTFPNSEEATLANQRLDDLKTKRP